LQSLFQKRWPFAKADLPLAAPFLAMLLSGIVSYAQSSFREGSLEEFSRRVFYALMAFVVIAEFRGLDRQRRLLRWLVAAFAVTVFYGFVQYFDSRMFPPGMGGLGLDPFIWRQAFAQRVFSSFGNPNFFGNFLVIITPILLTLYFRASGGRLFRPYAMLAVLTGAVILADKLFLNQFGGVNASNQTGVTIGLFFCLLLAVGIVWWKSASVAASGMLIFFGATFINLYSTETKGAWIGFVAAVVVFSLLAGLFLVGPRARRLTLLLIGIAGIFAGLGFVVIRHYALQRKQSVDFRVFTWIGTWDMIREQPVLGTGIGSFKWAYPAYRRPEIILLEGRSNTETDHAENEYLEVWYDEGLLGLGIFLWLIVAVSVLGFRSLASLTLNGPRPPPGPPFDDRVYKIIAFLGAWWGALLHWTMDVSVRFVSSGIYSLVLPALIVGVVRNDPAPERQDAPSSIDAWIRLGAALAVTVFFSWAHVPITHTLLAGAALIVIGEFLEHRLTPATPGWIAGPFLLAGGMCAVAQGVALIDPARHDSAMHFLRVAAALVLFLIGWGIRQTGRPAFPAVEWRGLFASRPGALPLAGAAALAACFAYGLVVWRGYFIGDIYHNVAIFFSKQSVWTNSPEFDARIQSPDFPVEMRRGYAAIGGALDHYEKTASLNPGFPMSRYFVGNVHNDWGSNFAERAKEAHGQGDRAAAEKLRTKAEEHWEKSLAAYGRVKAFAPNYVQTHHQVGLIYTKMADLETVWGDSEQAAVHWEKALENFHLYERLDPVFPANHYRISYVHFMRGEMDKAEQAYLGALRHNSANIVGRIYHNRNAETYGNLGRLCYIQLVNRFPTPSRAMITDPLFLKAVGYYEKSIEAARLAGQEAELGFDSTKALAVLYSRAGNEPLARSLWGKLHEWNPQDADVRRVFAPPSAPRP
jgi:tetratricopeptide (TPR) repeat protein/O-antigen ligase